MARGRIAVSLALALAAALSHAARAQDALPAALETCWLCHGAAGLPKDGTIPIVWGQRADYLEAQLRAYRSGDRENQIMNSMAESLKRNDLPAAAALIAGKAWPKSVAAAPGAAPETLAACQGCHGLDMMGAASPQGPAPRLAGQNAAYLQNQMVAFAHGERPNQETMSAMMQALNAQEQAALAAYLAGL